jgi:hypothetical protein
MDLSYERLGGDDDDDDDDDDYDERVEMDMENNATFLEENEG